MNALPSMDFALGETADAIREATARFAADRITPLAAEIDLSNAFPRSLWPEMGALGLHGVTVEEEFGGLGLGYLEHVVAWRKSRARPPLSVFPTAHTPIFASTKFDAGAGPSKRPATFRNSFPGEHVGALAMSEAEAGSDVVSMKLKGEKRGDRHILNGTKFWITNAPYADTLVVYAKTPTETSNRHITAFLIERILKGSG